MDDARVSERSSVGYRLAILRRITFKRLRSRGHPCDESQQQRLIYAQTLVNHFRFLGTADYSQHKSDIKEQIGIFLEQRRRLKPQSRDW